MARALALALVSVLAVTARGVVAAPIERQGDLRPGDFSPAALDRFEAAKHSVRLPSGLTIAYLDIGPRDGVPVLLVHGYTDSARDWMPLLPHLSPRLRLIIPDLRGHGDSARPACCYALVDFADDLAGLLDALKLRRVDVVGHSLGSLVAQVLAEDWPDRVGRVVLISSSGGLDPDATPEEKAARAKAFDFRTPIAALRDPIDPNSSFMRAWWGSPGAVNEEFIARQRLDSARMPARVWAEVLDQGLEGFDPAPGLKRLHAPVLLIWGERDPIMIPEVRHTLVAALPQARVAVLARDGHNPFWEEPAAVATALDGFLLDGH